MELLEIRYAGGEVVGLELPDGAALSVQQYARAIVHVTARRVTRGPAGTADVAAAVRAAVDVPELTEGDEVRYRGRRVIVCGARHGGVIFTSPGPVPEPEGVSVGTAVLPAVEPGTLPGASPYPSVRDGRWG